MKARISLSVFCPECNYVLLIDKLETAQQKLMYCPNSNCDEHLKPYTLPTIELEPWP